METIAVNLRELNKVIKKDSNGCLKIKYLGWLFDEYGSNPHYARNYCIVDLAGNVLSSTFEIVFNSYHDTISLDILNELEFEYPEFVNLYI